MLSAFITTAAPISIKSCSFHTSRCITKTNKNHQVFSKKFHPSTRIRMCIPAPQQSDNIVAGPIEGTYGNFYVTTDDINGVTAYRASLAAMVFLHTTGLFLSTSGLSVPQYVQDLLFFLSTGAFGIALQNIHIYARPMHNMLKVLWASGLFGAIVIFIKAFAGGESMASYVLYHPEAMLAVGWQFVALTGLFVKEALCYGRAEAYSLIAMVPVVCLSHFLSLGDFKVQFNLALIYAACFLYFCARKFAQSPIDDLGDLSIFQYLAKERGES